MSEAEVSTGNFETGTSGNTGDLFVGTTTGVTSDTSGGIMIPKDRFDEVNKRAKEAEKRLAELEKARQEAEKQAAEQQGKFEELYKAEAERAAKLEADLAAERNKLMRTRIATELGIPAPLATRLVGETEEELRADAEELLKLLPKRSEAPNIDSGAGTDVRSGSNGKVPSELPDDLKVYFNL